ncbi:MAG: MFS transporter [Proteobacteria bacterium]|nr:MFS transporter [Pseudomonadota bacterium]
MIPLSSTAQDYAGKRPNWLVATVLFMFAYLMSFIDRQILSILINPIKHDLNIDTTQFALLTGFAFSCIFGLIAFPMATQTDKRNRLPIILLSIVVWSSATVGCGFANSFAELFVMRALVGAGEAALAPAMLSYLADYIEERRLAGAIGAFSFGSFLGAGFSYLLGGYLLSLPGGSPLDGYEIWRVAFIAAGLPGYVIAVLIALFLRDPKRSAATRATAAVRNVAPPRVSAIRVFRDRWQFFCMMMGGYTMLACVLYTLLGWSAALYFSRFQMPAETVGRDGGICCALGGGCGALLSGAIANRLYPRFRTAAPYIVGAVSGLLAAGLVLGSLFAPSYGQSMVLLFFGTFFAAMSMPSENSSLQMAVEPELRGQFSAGLLFVNNVIGLSISSFLVGYLAQHVFADHGGILWGEAVVIGLCGLCGPLLVSRACLRREHPVAGVAYAA